MPETASSTMGVVLAVLSVPIAFVAGWFIHSLRSDRQRAHADGHPEEPGSFSREQLEVLWQNLSDASAEVQQVRATEQARQADAEERIAAAERRAAELEHFRTELIGELDTLRQSHQSATIELDSRQNEVTASQSLLDELQQQVTALKAELEIRSRELETAAQRVRELERVAGERQEQLAALRAIEAQALQTQGDLSVQLRARQEELERALTRLASAEGSSTATESLRLRVAALEKELELAERAHGDVATVLRERVASLEDTLSRSTSAFETVVRERSEAQLRDQRRLEEIASLRIELARRPSASEDVDALKAEIARRDALLADLAARSAAPPAPKPRRTRAKIKAESPLVPPAGPEVVPAPAVTDPTRRQLPSV